MAEFKVVRRFILISTRNPGVATLYVLDDAGELTEDKKAITNEKSPTTTYPVDPKKIPVNTSDQSEGEESVPEKGECSGPTCPCDLPLVTGPCRAYFPRFGFNKNSGKCEKFVYGGCRGNSNNFLTLEECEKRCGA